MKWNFTTDRPIYAQLIEQFTHGIISGELKAGEKLASVRDLAQEAAVNPNTMQKALAELERNGLVYTQRTSGRYITEDLEMINNIKSEYALEEITQFINKMKSIGFTKDEIIEFIKKSK